MLYDNRDLSLQWIEEYHVVDCLAIRCKGFLVESELGKILAARLYHMPF